MKSSIFTTVTSLILLAYNVTAQTPTAAALKPIKTLSCYKDVGNLTKMTEYDFATDGWCQHLCGDQGYPVMALTRGSLCYCGNIIPSLDKVIPQSNCNSPCNGFNLTNCGGFSSWQVYLTGLTNDVAIAPNSTTSSSSSSTPASTKADTTVVVTQSSSAGLGSNKVGIAVGVVVGSVVFSGILGGLIFFLKQRKKRAIEEEHRRLEAAAAAIAAEKSDAASTRTDQRLDPSNIYNNRRESIGSIADEMDFSRRILQVRNPDRFSTNSGAA